MFDIELWRPCFTGNGKAKEYDCKPKTNLLKVRSQRTEKSGYDLNELSMWTLQSLRVNTGS